MSKATGALAVKTRKASNAVPAELAFKSSGYFTGRRISDAFEHNSYGHLTSNHRDAKAREHLKCFIPASKAAVRSLRPVRQNPQANEAVALKLKVEALERRSAEQDETINRLIGFLAAQQPPMEGPGAPPVSAAVRDAPTDPHEGRRLRLVARVTQEAQRLDGVTAAYVHPSELSFTLVGPEWTPELSEAGAVLASTLQHELVPDLSVLVDGGFETAGPVGPDGWHRLLP